MSCHISLIAYTNEEQSDINKELHFSDHHCYFIFNLRKILIKSVIDSLGFISELMDRADSGIFMGEYDESDCTQNTDINPLHFDKLIDDIDRLISWCDKNIPETIYAFRDYGTSSEDELRSEMSSASDVSIDQHDPEYSGSPEFLFCALKSIQQFLMFAKENELSVRFINMMEC